MSTSPENDSNCTKLADWSTCCKQAPPKNYQFFHFGACKTLKKFSVVYALGHWFTSVVSKMIKIGKGYVAKKLSHKKHIIDHFLAPVPSVLWRCWLDGKKGNRPVKNWVVGYWHGYLNGARCRLAYGPANATATHCASCFSKIQIGFYFLVPAYLGSPEQRAVKRLCVCVFWHHLAETMEQCPPIVLCAVALWSLAYIPYFVNIGAIQALWAYKNCQQWKPYFNVN